MFLHNFKFTLKNLLRTKVLIFWTFAFPILLSLFFYLAFSGLEDNEKLKLFDIAVVKDEEYEKSVIHKEALKVMDEAEEEEKIFSVQYTTEDQAEKLLKEGEISGFVRFEEGKPIVVGYNRGADGNLTVLKAVMDEISQMGQVIEDRTKYEMMQGTLSQNPEELKATVEKITTKVLEEGKEKTYIEDQSPEKMTYTLIYFYSVIAMTCMYGGMLVMEALRTSLPNMSHEGMRVAVSPTPHWQVISSALAASYLIQLGSVTLLFLFTRFALGIDYSNHFGLVVLLTLVGCLAGLSLGIFSESVLSTNERMKIGFLLAFTMFGSFLSGMMSTEIKYVADRYIPWVNYLNPTRMITDGLYSLYYYDTLDRYFGNLVSLLLFSAVLIGISMFRLRRQRYDSI